MIFRNTQIFGRQSVVYLPLVCSIFFITGCFDKSELSLPENEFSIPIGIDLQSLNSTTINGVKQVCSTVVSEAHLFVNFTLFDIQPISAEQSEVIFRAIPVDIGTRIGVQLIGNTDAILYNGETVVGDSAISRRELELQLETTAPILRVCPDSLVLTPLDSIFTGSLGIENIGIGSLAWSTSGDSLLFLEPDSGSVLTGSIDTVMVTTATAPQQTLKVSVSSESGFVDITVTTQGQ